MIALKAIDTVESSVIDVQCTMSLKIKALHSDNGHPSK